MSEIPIPEQTHQRLIDTWTDSWKPYIDDLCEQTGLSRTEALAYMIAIRINDVVQRWDQLVEQNAHLRYNSDKNHQIQAAYWLKKSAQEREWYKNSNAHMKRGGELMDRAEEHMDDGDDWKG